MIKLTNPVLCKLLKCQLMVAQEGCKLVVALAAVAISILERMGVEDDYPLRSRIEEAEGMAASLRRFRERVRGWVE